MAAGLRDVVGSDAAAAATIARWRARGRHLDVFGRRVFVVEEGDSANTPPLLVLHGFPTSSHDFAPALLQLAADRRVVLLDFLGFGLSDKHPDDALSLIEQAEVALEVWRQLGVRRGHVLAHDYGTSVATELLARRERGGIPIQLESLTLCNGSMHIELASITATQKILRSRWAGPVLARLGSRTFFGARMRKILGRPEAIDDATLDTQWALIREADGHLRLPVISQYLDERVRFWSRWIGALRRVDVPVHVVWGRRDPIAVPAIAEQLATEIDDVTLSWLDDLGHYPMLEDPAQWAAAVTRFFDQSDGKTS